jgi:hypothetical protein
MTFRFSDEDLSSTTVGFNNSNKLLKLDSNGKVPTQFLDVSISSFSDILLTQPIINGQTLKYNSINSKWENKFLGDTNNTKAIVVSMTLSTGNTNLAFPTGSEISNILYLLTNTIDTKSITLFSAVNKSGLIVHIKRLFPQNSNIIIYPSAGEKIDNEIAQILTTDGQCLSIQSNGENWFII